MTAIRASIFAFLALVVIFNRVDAAPVHTYLPETGRNDIHHALNLYKQHLPVTDSGAGAVTTHSNGVSSSGQVYGQDWTSA